MIRAVMSEKTQDHPQIEPPGKRARPLRCRTCGRPHGIVLRCLRDGRWYDPEDATWRDRRGRRAPWPDVVEYAGTHDKKAVVRLVRPSGDPSGRPRALCLSCHMLAEIPFVAARNRLRARRRRALGDLFLGGYEEEEAIQRLLALLKSRRG